MVETEKRILTKENIDRQLAGQSSTTPFMNIKDNYNNKKITFNVQDGLIDKIDKLTVMMSQLTLKDEGQNKQFKPKIYQDIGKGQSRNLIKDAIMMSKVIKIDIDQTVEIEEFKCECRFLILFSFNCKVELCSKSQETEKISL